MNIKNKVILGLILTCVALLTTLVLVISFKHKEKPIVPVTITQPNNSYLANQHIDTVTITHYIDPTPSQPTLIDTTKPDVPNIQPGDTVYIVLDYFTGKTYLYEYKDSILELKAQIYIYNNKVFTVDPKYTFKEKIVTITNDIVSLPSWSIGLGGGVSYNSTEADIHLALDISRYKHELSLYYGILRKEIGVTYKYIILYK